MIYYQNCTVHEDLSPQEMEEGLIGVLEQLEGLGRILAIPPDYTRKHSFAGQLTGICNRYFGNRLTDILPALGTHFPMTEAERGEMYPDIPPAKFRVHNWRKDIVTLGEVPGTYVAEVSGGMLDYSWPAQVNRMLVEGDFEHILSIGQVVPHEVIGMANYNKNVFVGTGGPEGINKSHFLGAVYGMEKIMGRADNPVRRVLNYADRHFAADLPVLYILSVVSPDENRVPKLRGLFIGDDAACFEMAAEHALKVNFQMVEQPMKKVVVYLDPGEFKSTWLGNKSIYRTRMAIADGGELIVLAPGIKEFGEDRAIDSLIRKYGYRTTPEILKLVEREGDLRDNLSAAAHLIHGSSENRFSITYCPGHLNREEIEKSGFRYASLGEMSGIYDPERLSDGWNSMPGGEEIYYISNPALGLWACRERFEPI